jgi:hypothetical protein
MMSVISNLLPMGFGKAGRHCNTLGDVPGERFSWRSDADEADDLVDL